MQDIIDILKEVWEILIRNIKIFLKYISLVENNKSISLTNLLMYTVIYKIMVTPVVGVTDLVLLLGALTTYIHRRSIRNKSEKQEDDSEIQQ